jgi:hypothetical protein
MSRSAMPGEGEKDGVFYEDGAWHGYVKGKLVAVGPDQYIVRSAQRFHATADSSTANWGNHA